MGQRFDLALYCLSTKELTARYLSMHFCLLMQCFYSNNLPIELSVTLENLVIIIGTPHSPRTVPAGR
jgi:hypothetical protein